MWPHDRADDILQREGGSTENVIKACIAAFPSIWVSSIDYHGVPHTERLGLSVMSVWTFLSIFHGLIFIIALLLRLHILYMT